MAYAFNEDRSKVDVYTADQIDAMDLVNDEALADEVEARQAAVAQEIADRQAAVAQEIADRQAAVTTEAGTRSAGDAALGSRIDNIIASAGDGTIPTELLDIRNGNDASVYPVAGDMVRTGLILLRDNDNKLSEHRCYGKLFSQFVSFVRGSLTTQGVETSANYRVRSTKIIKFDENIFVRSASLNYRFGIQTFDENNQFISDSGWKYHCYMIPANTYFRIVISKVNNGVEDTSITADISEFVTALSFDNKLLYPGDIEIDQPLNFGYNFNGHIINPDVTRLNTVITPDKDICLLLADDDYDFGVRLLNGNNLLDNTLAYSFDSGWQKQIFYLEKDRNYMVALRKENNSNIVPEEFFNAVKLLMANELEFFNENSKINDPENFIVKGALLSGVLYKPDPDSDPWVKNRCATVTYLKFPYTVVIIAKEGYRVAAHYYSSNYVFQSDSGWNEKLVIPANQIVRLTFSSWNDSVNVTIDDCGKYYSILNEFVDNVSRVGIGSISMKPISYNIEHTKVKPSTPTQVGATTHQGFGVNNGVLFQFYSDDKVELRDFSTGSLINQLDCDTGHGNAIAFFNEKYDQNDEFDLAIVSDTLVNPRAYLCRLSRSAVTILKTLAFDPLQAGYYANVMIDPLNKLLYTVGYTQPTYTDPTNNRMVFAKWNFETLVENQDGTYTPEFIESFTTPFMLVMQGSAFYNGYLFVVSSSWDTSVDKTKIYIVDPAAKNIKGLLTEFNYVIENVETEAIFFEDSGSALVHQNMDNSPYYRIVFN